MGGAHLQAGLGAPEASKVQEAVVLHRGHAERNLLPAVVPYGKRQIGVLIAHGQELARWERTAPIASLVGADV